jgi:hypothetical protein
MRLHRMIACLSATAFIGSACGRTTMESPTSPSPAVPPSSAAAPSPSDAPSPAQYPSLQGQWNGSTGLTVTTPGTDSTDDTFSAEHCNSNMLVESQTGAEFAGGFQTFGSGRRTDPLCGNTTKMTGVMTANGAVTLRFTPVLESGYCTHVSGDEHFTGAITDGTVMTAERTDRVTCRNPANGAPIEGERTRTMKVTLRKL